MNPEKIVYPLVMAYVLIVLLAIAGFLTVGTLAEEAKVEACSAFKDSQQLLKDVLVLSIPIEDPDVRQLPENEKQQALADHERRIAFRDRLITTIEERECE